MLKVVAVIVMSTNINQENDQDGNKNRFYFLKITTNEVHTKTTTIMLVFSSFKIQWNPYTLSDYLRNIRSTQLILALKKSH